jgi:uncharacterized lipoprotein YmbA
VRRAWILIVLCAGCALTRKSKPMDVRYFAPTPRPVAESTLAGPAPAPGGALELRLGNVRAATYLGEKIAFRDSELEVGYYETLRWTENPEEYLRAGLSRALFEQHGVKEVVSGLSPTLEVQLTAFDELREPKHVARVEVVWKLRDHRSVLRQRTVTVERPIANRGKDDQGEALAGAMGAALAEVVDSVVADVLTELGRPR